ncbi:MAG: hypothetical protein Fur0041_13980 [Bacteroidia bacterium]
MSKEHQHSQEEESKDLKPFIHQSDNFISAYFGKLPEHLLGEKQKNDDKQLFANFIQLLTDSRNHDVRNEVLAVLKKNKSTDLLLELISRKEYQKHRKELVAACWESGLDFSKHLETFVDLALNETFEVCLEAYTVIDNMEGPFEKGDIEKIHNKLKDYKKEEDKSSIIDMIRMKMQHILFST